MSEVACGLAKVLDELDLDLVFHSLVGAVPTAPWTGLDELVARCARLPEPWSTLSRWLFSGEAVELERVRCAVPDPLIEGLVESGLAHCDGSFVRLTNRVLRRIGGIWLLLDRWEPATPSRVDLVYLGDDSYLLASCLPAGGGTALDLGAGTGIQGLILASRGWQVVSCDVNPHAAALARFNAALNRVSERVEVFTGDLFEPVAGRRFDLICCDPPFLPVNGAHAEIFADGGRDGLSVVRRVLAGLPGHLAAEGRALLLAGSFGTRGTPALAAELREWAEAHGIQARVSILAEVPASQHLRSMARKYPSLEEPLEQTRESLDRAQSHYYVFLLHLRRGEGSVTVMKAQQSMLDRIRSERGVE